VSLAALRRCTRASCSYDISCTTCTSTRRQHRDACVLCLAEALVRHVCSRQHETPFAGTCAADQERECHAHAAKSGRAFTLAARDVTNAPRGHLEWPWQRVQTLANLESLCTSQLRSDCSEMCVDRRFLRCMCTSTVRLAYACPMPAARAGA
jgi:hypothetical protein